MHKSFVGWIAGRENATDLVSKVFIDQIEAINSDLFRHGGTFMVTKGTRGKSSCRYREKVV